MIPDTSSAPYFDDYDPSKNFAKILFKPGFPVQTRELNQLQTLLQKQIERFGNKVLKQGTVVSGCQTTAAPKVPYVKLKDTQANGKSIDVTTLESYYVKNQANTVGIILSGINGSENSAPDLNTVYVRYINSGDDGVTSSFAASEQLTVYNPTGTIERVVINSGSAGFSPSDELVFLPAAKLANVVGTLNVGDIVSDGNGANVAIAQIRTVGSDTIVNFRAQLSDRVTGNAAAWTITAGAAFIDSNTSATFSVDALYGTGASATLSVNGIGEIKEVAMTSTGTGYTELPTVFPVSASATTNQHSAVALSAENFFANISVAGSLTSPIGYGYGLTIDEGIVFHSGYFTRTDRQFLVVSKYTTSPTGLAVGFDTSGTIVTAADDLTLLDNQLGSPNYTAPGADRLKISAEAIVLTAEEAAARPEFLSIVEFSEGEPYKQDSQTQSELLDQYMARRTFEESGNFVIDPFIVTTTTDVIANEPASLKVAVDPGTGYIDGYRVSTQRNYVTQINKGTTTKSANSIVSSTSYGNYFVCDQVVGNIAPGTVVTLRNQYNTVAPGSAIASTGTQIGQAYVRGIQKVGNVWRVYLFDVQMSAGQKIADAKSLYASNFYANVQTAVLVDATSGQAIFKLPVSAAKTVSNTSYQYQKSSWGTVTANTTGFVTLTLSAPEEVFPVAGTLQSDQIDQIFISPSANLVATAAFTGTIDTTNGSNTVTGSSTLFLTEAKVGSFIQYANATMSGISKIVSIANNTSLTLSPAPTITLAAGNAKLAFPKDNYAQIASVTVSGDRKTLTASLGTATNSGNITAIATVQRTPTVAAKTVTRNAAIRVDASSHVANTVGPWSVGFSDVIRLNGVYRGANNTFTAAQGTEVTDNFYLDANHSPDSLGTGYLFKKPSSSLTLNTTDRLLVVFDVLSRSSSEVVTIASYPVNDAVTLAASAATINTVELPEVFGSADRYFDARDSYDFRPSYSNTVAITTSQATAPINPSEPAYASRYTLGTRFPAPASEATSNIEYYVGRYDRIVVTTAGDIKVLAGTPGQDAAPAQPDQAITINELYIPPYPSLAAYLGSDMNLFSNNRIASEKYATRRIGEYTVKATFTPAEIAIQQPRGYTMRDIGSLDRRLNDVEYYLSLTLAETNTGKRSIASANDPSTDRFKFGYFTDSFADTSYADYTNPQFTASIADNVVLPVQNRYVISLDASNVDSETDGFVSAPFNEYRLLGQTRATDGAVVVPKPPVVQPPVVEPKPPVVTPNNPAPVVFNDVTQEEFVNQRTENVLRYNVNNLVDQTGKVKDVWEFVMSSKSGLANVFFNFRDIDCAIDIYQGTTPNFDITGKTPIKNCYAATGWVNFSIAGQTNPWNGLHTENRALNAVKIINGIATVQDSGQIKIDWNPAGGRYLKIVITKMNNDGGYGAKGRYSFRFIYPTDDRLVYTIPKVPAVIEYKGQFTNVSPNSLTPDVVDTGTAINYNSKDQAIQVTVAGLKPSTVHTFTFGGVDKTAVCAPEGGSVGQPLKSKSDGKLSFIFYFNRGDLVSNLTASQPLSKKAMTVTDNSSSFASYVVEIKPYVYSTAPAPVAKPVSGFAALGWK